MQNYEYEYLPGGRSFFYTEVNYPQGRTNRVIHAHDRHELLIIDTPGSIRFVSNDNFYTFQTPAAVWIRAGVFHQTLEVLEGDFHCCVIYYHEKLFSKLPVNLLHTDFLSGCDLLWLPLSPHQVRELNLVTAPMQVKTSPQFQNMALLLCLFDKLSHIAGRCKQVLRAHTSPHYVFQLAARLQDLTRPMPKLEALAHEYFVGQSKLTADFKNIFGMPILTFRQHVQLRAAMVLLETTAMDLSQIAEECGFADDNYFIRLFRKRHGITPGAYRRKFKQGA